MPILVTGGETTLEELDRRLFRTGVSDAAVKRLRAVIRKANPDVDFADLQPGTVIRLPSAPELRAGEDLSFDDSVAQAIGATRDQLTAELKELAVTVRGRQRNAAVERKTARSLLGSKEVKGAAAQDAGVARAVDSVASALDREDSADAQRQETAKIAVSQWADGLAALDRLVP
jgi:hypothetical protein